MSSEIDQKADFSIIRYAQCWEDADILVEALGIQSQCTYVSIASAGDNVLAMLSRRPARLIALDLSPAQLACLELRVAAYRCLDHGEMLELLGAVPSRRRGELYGRCRTLLEPATARFWDAMPEGIEQGVGNIGKFERYLALFGRRILPFLESKRNRHDLLVPRTRDERAEFYEERWNNRRWRAVFRLFFSRYAMGWLGRDPDFFNYVETNVAERILERTRYALVELDPTQNPYLHWILRGRYETVLPYALRPENFDEIRTNLDRLEWHCQSLEAFLADNGPDWVDGYNLSDIFEYMSFPNYEKLLQQLVESGRPGARLVYWNMLAPRRRPQSLACCLHSLDDLSTMLFGRDKAFFYSDFVVEEIRSA